MKVRNKQILKPGYSGEPDATREIAVRDSGQVAVTQQDMHPVSEDMIRKIMAEQWREANRRSLPEILPNDSDKDDLADFSDRSKRWKVWGKVVKETPDKGFDGVPEEVSQPRPGLLARRVRRQSGPEKPGRGSFLKRWHVLLGGLGIAMVLNPTLIPSLLMGVFWAMIAGSLMFGPGRVADFIHGAWLWVLRRNPGFAATLRKTGDRIVLARNAVLTRLSGHKAGHWATEGQGEGEADADHGDPFDTRHQTEVFRG